jgi:hypothetical protein
MNRRRLLVIGGLIYLLVAGATYLRVSNRWRGLLNVKPMELTTDAVWQLRAEGRVGAGMTKARVIELAGLPYNPVAEDVWIWSLDVPRPSTPSSWREFGDGGALFLVFEDGKTISSFCATGSASPQELYAAKRDIEEGSVPERYCLEGGVK